MFPLFRCKKVIAIPEKFSELPLSFAYQKNSSLRLLLDYQVTILDDNAKYEAEFSAPNKCTDQAS